MEYWRGKCNSTRKYVVFHGYTTTNITNYYYLTTAKITKRDVLALPEITINKGHQRKQSPCKYVVFPSFP